MYTTVVAANIATSDTVACHSLNCHPCHSRFLLLFVYQMSFFFFFKKSVFFLEIKVNYIWSTANKLKKIEFCQSEKHARA